MANSERQHHALANPDYRFQPQPRQPSSLGKPTAQLRSKEFSENNGKWSHNDGSDKTTSIPIDIPSLGYNARGILDDPPRLFVSEPERRLGYYRFLESTVNGLTAMSRRQPPQALSITHSENLVLGIYLMIPKVFCERA